MQRSL